MTIVVLVLTLLSIWLFGLGQHRTIFENSLLSTTILSIAFFLFLTMGLYNGIKLKDDIGRITDQINSKVQPKITGRFNIAPDFPDIGEGIVGILMGIVLWILFSIALLLIMWLFSALLWTMVLVFAAMLYWIFFRAVRLVFKNSNKCKGNLPASAAYGVGYTILYNFWIYGIILAAHYLGN